jgi:transcriptional regulator with XRE-family HTH domain
MDYDDRRQLSSSQFGSFPIPDRMREHEILYRLGEAFQQIRAERGLGIDQLAAMTSIPAARINALEAGELDPDYDLLLLLSGALGVSSSSFVLRAEALAKEGHNET